MSDDWYEDITNAPAHSKYVAHMRNPSGICYCDLCSEPRAPITLSISERPDYCGEPLASQADPRIETAYRLLLILAGIYACLMFLLYVSVGGWWH